MSDRIEVVNASDCQPLIERLCDGIQFHVVESVLATKAGLGGMAKMHESRAREECSFLMSSLCKLDCMPSIKMTAYVPNHGTDVSDMLSAYQRWEAGTLQVAIDSDGDVADEVIDSVFAELELIRKMRQMNPDDVDKWLFGKF